MNLLLESPFLSKDNLFKGYLSLHLCKHFLTKIIRNKAWKFYSVLWWTNISNERLPEEEFCGCLWIIFFGTMVMFGLIITGRKLEIITHAPSKASSRVHRLFWMVLLGDLYGSVLIFVITNLILCSGSNQRSTLSLWPSSFEAFVVPCIFHLSGSVPSSTSIPNFVISYS